MRDGAALPAFYLGKACPHCGGRGWRITTHDGTRPACITCAGTGIVPDLPEPLPQPEAAPCPAC
ncbi:MAG: hypothetical protein LCH38_10920 [Proteobacteria bacterium]|nr:hypothetical protein [Pseudomonadota bacterium]